MLTRWFAAVLLMKLMSGCSFIEQTSSVAPSPKSSSPLEATPSAVSTATPGASTASSATPAPTALINSRQLDQVVSVGDGDTIRATSNGKTLTIRLACVDAPETAQTPWGKDSTFRLKQLLPAGQNITLRVINTDRYGRTVAEVSKGNTSVNLQMVQEGQAAVYQRYLSGCPSLRDQLLNAEAEAKQQQFCIPK